MILTGRIRITKPYSGKTKFDFFNDLKVETIVKVQVEIKMYYGTPKVIFSYKEKFTRELKSFKSTWGASANYIKNMME